MSAPRPRRAGLSLAALIPNLITISGLAAGLTAIRLGLEGRYEPAVLLILLAALLDGIDGRVARMVRADGGLGAELDSLADFANFGVAPALIVYSWQLEGRSEAAWLAALAFAVACVLRLARFNLARSGPEDGEPKVHFAGVPAPAGALLGLMPLYLAFASDGALMPPPGVTEAWLVAVGLAMISTLPTPSAKGLRISRGNARYVVLGFALMLAAAATWPWPTLIALCVAYVLTVAVFNLRRIGRGGVAGIEAGAEPEQKNPGEPLHKRGENQ